MYLNSIYFDWEEEKETRIGNEILLLDDKVPLLWFTM